MGVPENSGICSRVLGAIIGKNVSNYSDPYSTLFGGSL